MCAGIGAEGSDATDSKVACASDDADGTGVVVTVNGAGPGAMVGAWDDGADMGPGAGGGAGDVETTRRQAQILVRGHEYPSAPPLAQPGPG